MNLIQDWLPCEYQTKEKVALAFGPFVTWSMLRTFCEELTEASE